MLNTMLTSIYFLNGKTNFIQFQIKTPKTRDLGERGKKMLKKDLIKKKINKNSWETLLCPEFYLCLYPA